MINHIWSVLSQSSSIDQETNNISLFNILERLTIYSEKVENIRLPIKFVISSLWEQEDKSSPSKGKVRILLINPNNVQNESFEIDIDFSQSHYHRTRVNFDGLVLSGPGRYTFRVDLLDDKENIWKHVAELPLIINFDSSQRNEE